MYPKHCAVPLVLLLLACPRASAAEPDTADLLEQFRESWDEDAWGPPGKQPGYMRPLDDRGWKKRIEILQSLVRSPDTEAIQKTLQVGSAPERILAAQAIGYGRMEACRKALATAAEHDKDAAVRLYAVDALGKLGGKQDGELFRRLLKQEQNKDVRQHLTYAIEREGRGIEEEVRTKLTSFELKRSDGARVGQRAPDFELASLSSGNVRLSSYHGKQAVVLVFVYGDT